MRRVAAAVCLAASVASAVFAMAIIYKFTVNSPSVMGVQDWRVFIPLFFPCFVFLFGMLVLMFFTTWEDIKGIVGAASGVNRQNRNVNFNNDHSFHERQGRMIE